MVCNCLLKRVLVELMFLSLLSVTSFLLEGGMTRALRTEIGSVNEILYKPFEMMVVDRQMRARTTNASAVVIDMLTSFVTLTPLI